MIIWLNGVGCFRVKTAAKVLYKTIIQRRLSSDMDETPLLLYKMSVIKYERAESVLSARNRYAKTSAATDYLSNTFKITVGRLWNQNGNFHTPSPTVRSRDVPGKTVAVVPSGTVSFSQFPLISTQIVPYGVGLVARTQSMSFTGCGSIKKC